MSNETLSAEELGNKLLQSVKEMKARNAARVSRVEPNEVAEARGKTGLTQREFAEVLHISPRTLQELIMGFTKTACMPGFWIKLIGICELGCLL